MKKILALAIVAVLTVALCVSASAVINIDKMGVNDNTYNGGAGNVVGDNPIEITKGDKIYLLGWAYGSGHLVKLVWSVDGGADNACSDNYRDRYEITPILGIDEALGENAGFGHDNEDQGGMLELVGVDKLAVGTYKLTVKAIYSDDSSETKDFNLKVNAGASTTAKYAIAEAPGGVGVWLREDSESVTVKFTTTGSFSAIGFNSQYWASCIATKTGSEADWTVELYKFAYNTENTLSKKPVATAKMHSTADNTPGFGLEFDEQAAGTYIVKVTITNPTYEEEVGGEMKKPYLVLPAITNPDETKFEFNGGAFNLSITGEKVNGEFFAANPEETEAPAGGDDNPGTADAAVIAIAAVACLALAGVVVAKKVK